MRDLQEKSTLLSSLNENLIREMKCSTVNDPKKGPYKLKKSEISRSCSSWRLTEVVGLSCVSHMQYAEN